MNLMKKIAAFESLPVQNVEKFNELFLNCKLNWDNQEAEVEIGEIVGPFNRRKLLIEGVECHHTFPVVIFEEGEYMQTNADLENLVMEEKELALEPIEYVLLQYFRGCQSIYHTQVEIAKKVNKSVRSIRDVLKRMEDKDIITTLPVPNMHKMTVTLNEGWD